MLDPYLTTTLYRQELERVERELALRRHLPERARRGLPHARLTFARPRRRARLAGPSGC